MIERLVAALREEFDEDSVSLHEVPPTNPIPPCVVVAPGSPFLTNTTHGFIQESWEVLVFVGTKTSDRGVESMRKVSLKVRKAVSSAGAVWHEAEQPRQPKEDAAYAVVINKLSFRYDPEQLIN